MTGGFHGRRNLAGYSLWGHKESDTTEQLTPPPPPRTHTEMKGEHFQKPSALPAILMDSVLGCFEDSEARCVVSAAGAVLVAGVLTTIALWLLTLKTTTVGVFSRAFSLPGHFQVGANKKIKFLKK